jgi:hypothetical protein
MNLCKKSDKVWTELYLKKKTADRQWDRILLDALHGKIDKDAIVYAMDQCNVADQNLIDFERMNKKLKTGKVGYSDDDYHRLYIKPYENSKAP